jgi:hypothetical protein
MANIDIRGLLGGKRINRCAAEARWHFPYYFLLSNAYARIELDYESIALHFVSFRGSAPTAEDIEIDFKAYIANHLIFVYRVGSKLWGQWDCRREQTVRHKDASSKRSPHPPEAEYQEWLKAQHPDDWGMYHWSAIHGKISVLVSDTSENLEKLPKDAEELEIVPRGVGVGVGVGVGSGVGVGGGKTIEQNQDFKPSECTPVVRTALGISGQKNWITATEAIEAHMAANPGSSAAKSAEEIARLWPIYRASPKGKRFPMNPEKWLTSGEFLRQENWTTVELGESPPKPAASTSIDATELIRERQAKLKAFKASNGKT